MQPKCANPPPIVPRIILHGGAGNIKRENLPREAYEAYKASLLSILAEADELLSKPDATALDVAVHAVTLLEDDPLFNCGKGAVFTRAGTNELEASVMVSRGYRKRGVGCMTLKHVKNPIKLAREMLVRGEQDDGGGAGGHSQISGAEMERLAARWGLEMVDENYFFTQKRWDEHIRGLEKEKGMGVGVGIGTEEAGRPIQHDTRSNGGPSWDGHEYLPQGTVGAVVLDRFGTICAATSTGGLTNKLPGRIGDTPTLGAGFWAEAWTVDSPSSSMIYKPAAHSVDLLSRGDISGLVDSCLPGLSRPNNDATRLVETKARSITHAVGMSGTGNGDSFLRMSAVRTAAAMARFTPDMSLAQAVRAMAGSGGELEKSAGDRFGKTGEGEGGIIGIELVDNNGRVTWDFNCGGMFRAWVDDAGKHHFMAFKGEY